MRSFSSITRTLARGIGGAVGSASRGWGGIIKAYEAGRNDRIDRDFGGVRPEGPNAMAERSLPAARARVRWLCENHPLIRGAAQSACDNVIGTGITSDFDTPWDGVNAALEELREQIGYCQAVDAGRELGEAELQRLAFLEVFGGGEILVHNVIAPEWGGYAAGPAVELIDAERLEMSGGLGGALSAIAGKGNRIRQSVEVDSMGRRVAYHVLASNPDDGDWRAIAAATRRLSAEDARLIFLRRRVGQLRGVPMPISAVLLTRFAQRYGEAALAQAMSAACMGIWIKGVTTPKVLKALGTHSAVDPDGEPITELEPGLLGILPKEADIMQANPNQPGPQFVSVNDWLERHQARGIGMGFAEYTGDWGRMTYSSSRSESLGSRKFYRPLQAWFASQYCWWTMRAFTRWAVSFGHVTLSAEQRRQAAESPTLLYRIRCQPNGWEWVDPKSEAQASEIELSLGLNSPQAITAGRGSNYYRITTERLEAEKFEADERKRLGLPPKAPSQPTSKKDEPRDDDREEPKPPSRGRLAALNGSHHE